MCFSILFHLACDVMYSYEPVMYSFELVMYQLVMVMKLCQGHVFFLQKQLNGIAAAISRYGYAWSAAKRLSRLFKTLLKNKGPATAVGVH